MQTQGGLYSSAFLSASGRHMAAFVRPAEMVLRGPWAVREVHVWDVARGERVSELISPGIRWAVFSPDGQSLATVHVDHRVVLWDWGKQTTLAVLEGHEGEVGDVRFFPDGRRLATSSRDCAVLVWEIDGRAKTSGQ